MCARVLAACLFASVLTILPSATPAKAAPGPFCPQTSQVVSGSIQVTVTCDYTGAAQYWQAPSNIGQVRVEVFGAQGGRGVDIGACPSCNPPRPQYYEPGGKGASADAIVSVTGNQTYQIMVGGSGGREEPECQGCHDPCYGCGGFNGGGAGGHDAWYTPGYYWRGPGGGGASDIRNGSYALSNRLVVAGGGGGSAATSAGGAGGQDGTSGEHVYYTMVNGYGPTNGGGGGGTQTAGGVGGAHNPYISCGYTKGPDGTLGAGGNGGDSPQGCGAGGGGGGGYYGGGGGNGLGNGGGGGSSYGPAGTTYGTGIREGNGLVRITYTANNSAPSCESYGQSVNYNSPEGIQMRCTDPGATLYGYSIVSGPTHGTISNLNTETGNALYTPATNYTGSDSFTFRNQTTNGVSNTATVTINVVPTLPRCGPVSVVTKGGTAKTISFDCTSVVGYPNTYTAAQGPFHGTLSAANQTAGTVVYTPTAGYSGTDSFDYGAYNTPGGSSWMDGRVTISVDNTAPTVSFTSPTAGSSVGRGSTVAADYACSDTGGATVATCTGTVADGAAIDTSTLGQSTFSVTTTDSVGNSRTQSFTYNVVDDTKPTVTIAAPLDGAVINRDAVVNADFSCADDNGGEGIDTCIGMEEDGSPIATGTIGNHWFSVTATDKVGNTVTKTISYTVKDVTDPTVSLLAPLQGAVFAQNEAVGANFSCTDDAGGSGAATCVGTVAHGADLPTADLGSHTFSVTATDYAGNDFTQTITYTVVDVTKPDVTIAAPIDGGIFDRGAEVVADFDCADETNGSGMDTCTGTVADGSAIDTSTAGTKSFVVTGVDQAGNTRTRTFSYRVMDITKPAITVDAPLDGGTIARHEVVPADYSCSDETGGSGIDTCIGTLAKGALIDTSTLGSYSFSVTATDKDGNSLQKEVSYTVVDVTEPTITFAAPLDGDDLTQGENVVADFSCSDEAGGSGLDSCAGSTDDGQPMDTEASGQHSLKVTATDIAGNVHSETIHYMVRDVTDPNIKIATPWDGAVFVRNELIPADFTCTDNQSGSGITTCEGTVSQGADIDTSTLGEHFFDVDAVDQSGNTSSERVSYTVIDVNRPSITIDSPTQGDVFIQNSIVKASYSCSDDVGGSGIESCIGPIPSAGRLDTSTVGQHSFKVTATDIAGNTQMRTVTYQVQPVGVKLTNIWAGGPRHRRLHYTLSKDASVQLSFTRAYVGTDIATRPGRRAMTIQGEGGENLVVLGYRVAGYGLGGGLWHVRILATDSDGNTVMRRTSLTLP
jgi:uncharacterized UPF0146 family protein